MTVPNELANRLRDALNLTSEAPFMRGSAEADRRRVAREYREVHQTLEYLQRFLQGWTPPQ